MLTDSISYIVIYVFVFRIPFIAAKVVAYVLKRSIFFSKSITLSLMLTLCIFQEGPVRSESFGKEEKKDEWCSALMGLCLLWFCMLVFYVTIVDRV